MAAVVCLCVCLSVDIFKLEYLRNQWANRNEIVTEPSLGWGKGCIRWIDHLARFRDTFLSSDHSHMSVNDMWVSFKSEVIAAIERFIPTKMTKTKYSLPWINSSIRRVIRKREKLYFRARKSSSPDVKNHYKRFRAHVQKVIRDAYWKHISNIFSFETESPDPDSPRKNEKAKKFWSFVKSLKKRRVWDQHT